MPNNGLVHYLWHMCILHTHFSFMKVKHKGEDKSCLTLSYSRLNLVVWHNGHSKIMMPSLWAWNTQQSIGNTWIHHPNNCILNIWIHHPTRKKRLISARKVLLTVFSIVRGYYWSNLLNLERLSIVSDIAKHWISCLSQSRTWKIDEWGFRTTW